MKMTQVQKPSSQEKNSYLLIEDFLLWAQRQEKVVPTQLQTILKKHNWLKDTRALKCLFSNQMLNYLGLNEDQIELLSEILYEFSPVEVKSIADIDKEASLFFSTNSKKVDGILHGGVETGHLYEFAGPPASGKTQICYATLLSCYGQTNGDSPGNSVLWIDTEHSLLPNKISGDIKKQKQNQEHIFNWIRVHTLHEFIQALLEMLRICQSKNNLRLIIIDSLIAPFNNYYQNDYPARSQALREILAFLKNVSRIFSCAIIITNQVRGPITEAEKQSQQKYFPLGGVAFAHTTENRFLLEPLEGRRRQIKVLDSSYLPSDATDFYLTKEGIVDEESCGSAGKPAKVTVFKSKKALD
ncbi:MAG: AAA family ATPase [Candidatus Heimdallarchaeota archaeon]|nr:AAA family ATPase [Candidatus Heimdallarchaeota archaeon]